MNHSKSLEPLWASSAFKLQTASQLLNALKTQEQKPPLATAIETLDQLQGGGLPRGSLIELAGTASSGRMSVLLSLLAQATQSGEISAFVDIEGHFDPVMAHNAGVVLSRTLWLFPRTIKEAMLSAEMLLQSQFGLVLLDTGMEISNSKIPTEFGCIRLARAARDHHGVVLLAMPQLLRRKSSRVLIELKQKRLNWSQQGHSLLFQGSLTTISIKNHQSHEPQKTSEIAICAHQAISRQEVDRNSFIEQKTQNQKEPFNRNINSYSKPIS